MGMGAGGEERSGPGIAMEGRIAGRGIFVKYFII
jgi:hypothetical protein